MPSLSYSPLLLYAFKTSNGWETFVCFVFDLETGFLCVMALAVLELVLVDQTGLKFIETLPTSASRVLGIKVCTTTAWFDWETLIHYKCS